ncbi:MAG: MATE family efflux transporter [Phycisphaeraceae bacterium]|nr:MAG: MATE family efflux transporter [Phycisphaeraceae bacterium]
MGPGGGSAPVEVSAVVEPAEGADVPLSGRDALRQMFMIAAPSVVTMTSYSAMQFVDRLMVKEIGPEPKYIAAQGTAGIATWTLMTFCVGLTGVVSSFVSQNLGAGKPERGAAYAWMSMWIGLAYWAMVMIPGALMARRFFGLFGHEAEVVNLEVGYAVIAMGGALFTLMSKGMHNYFFGLHRPGVVAVAVVLGNITNILANTVLIFGAEGLDLGVRPETWHGGAAWSAISLLTDSAAWVAGTLGIPAMGLAGAALGTVIGTVVEWGLPLLVFLAPAHNKEYKSRGAWFPRWLMFKDICRIGWPAGLMFLNELLLWAYMMSFLTPRAAERAAELSGASAEAAKAVGTSATTTGFIALQWMHLSFMPAIGISIATQAMVGKAMGAKRPDAATRTTWLGLKITMVYMGACALLFVVFARPLIGLFINAETPPDEVEHMVRLGAQIMIAAAVFQLFDAMVITTSAALRGAGDTIWPGVVTIVTSWVFIFGLGHLLIEVAPGIGGLSPWIGASAYICALGVLMTVRFLGGKWKTMRLVHDDPLHNLPPDELAPGTSPGA